MAVEELPLASILLFKIAVFFFTTTTASVIFSAFAFKWLSWFPILQSCLSIRLVIVVAMAHSLFAERHCVNIVVMNLLIKNIFLRKLCENSVNGKTIRLQTTALYSCCCCCCSLSLLWMYMNIRKTQEGKHKGLFLSLLLGFYFYIFLGFPVKLSILNWKFFKQ